VSAKLIDDHTLVLTGPELILASQLGQYAIKAYAERNGGAAPSIEWEPMMRRGANVTAREMSQVTRDQVISPPDEPESAVDSRKRDLSVIEAAAVIGISRGHLHRLIRARTPALVLAR
jgi:hypothetical protein